MACRAGPPIGTVSATASTESVDGARHRAVAGPDNDMSIIDPRKNGDPMRGGLVGAKAPVVDAAALRKEGA